MDKEPSVVKATDRHEPELPLVATTGIAGNTLGNLCCFLLPWNCIHYCNH